ncbi:MAG: sigma 54-interacting transcriptional regulator [Smithellaceae bacterium]|nr:sigma 54-interacting transcriptional regulator [Smithellaceae bacterium]
MIEKYCDIKNGALYLKEMYKTNTFGNIVTCNPYMLDQIKLIQRISQSNATVMISGLTGTGKELYAEYVHQVSCRSDESFLKINCATIDNNLFESELFGYAPGSFTGALKNGKKGIVEMADKGTLFLDEISEMSPILQSKFLRLLQEGSFIKVGDYKETRANVRFIAATNKDLMELVKHNEFREDLYYRLNVIPITLTALNQRPEDIILLSLYFLDKFNNMYHAKRLINAAFMEKLLAYDWPGNVRELQHMMERIVLLASSDYIEADEFSLDYMQGLFSKHAVTLEDIKIQTCYPQCILFDKTKSLKEMVEEYEVTVIKEYIANFGSLRKAAAALKTSPSVLSRKINRS